MTTGDEIAANVAPLIDLRFPRLRTLPPRALPLVLLFLPLALVLILGAVSALRSADVVGLDEDAASVRVGVVGSDMMVRINECKPVAEEISQTRHRVKVARDAQRDLSH